MFFPSYPHSQLSTPTTKTNKKWHQLCFFPFSYQEAGLYLIYFSWHASMFPIFNLLSLVADL